MKYLLILLSGFEISDGIITHFLVRNGLAPIALSLPLQEAGRDFRDEELAWLYCKLRKGVGWTIEPN